MYANLLLSSMDDRTAEYVHPSFVQLLKEISPDEAKLLHTLEIWSGLGYLSVLSISRMKTARPLRVTNRQRLYVAQKKRLSLKKA